MEYKKYENKLLLLLQEIKKIESEFPELSSKKLNIFEAAGLVRQEIRHSKALAFLLNPNESHDLGDAVFKKLITNEQLVEIFLSSNSNDAPSPLKLALSDFDDLVVRTEDMQIDILAWSPKNSLVVAIENKVGATEGKEQLSRYKNKIFDDERFKGFNKVFIYLTPDGDEASNSTWIPISYKLILETLESVTTDEFLSNETQLFISHYIEIIRKHVVSEENQEFKSACLALYGKHKEIFDLIYENIDIGGSRTEAINRFKEKYKDSITVHFSNNSWLSFTPNVLYNNMTDIELSRQWQRQNKPVAFFFELNKDRIKLVIEVGPVKNLEIRNNLVKTLYKNMKNENKEARSDTYTRVWTKTEKLDPNLEVDDIGSDAVFNKMETLYNQTSSLIEKIKSSIFETNLNS